MTDDDRDNALRVHDQITKEKSEYLKAALDASVLVIRSLILVNGAAVVVLLAFLGTLQTGESVPESIFSYLTGSIQLFAYGVGTGVLTAVCAYAVNLMEHKKARHTFPTWEWPYFEYPDEAKETYAIRNLCFLLTLCFGSLSLIFFFIAPVPP